MVLYQPTNGYCYNSDTHFLYNFIVENFKKYKNIKGELLDIGSGSGILGLLVAKDFEKLKLNQCEIQKMFQFFSTKNSNTNKIDSILYEGSYENIDFEKKFDICVSNPPFYNSDTHFLYNFIVENLKKYKNIKGEILDIGSGSGILGLLVAKDFEKIKLNQCEIQEMFQFFTKKNSETNKINSKLYEGSFSNIEFDKKFDICVSNPPFYHSDVIKSENESLKIARYNDSLPLEIFIKKTATILNSEGKFFFCYDVKQINEILLLLNKYKFNLEALQFVHPKESKDATLVLVYAKRNSKSLTKVLTPLIVFDEKNEFTSFVQDIYKKSSTHSIKVDIG